MAGIIRVLDSADFIHHTKGPTLQLFQSICIGVEAGSQLPDGRITRLVCTHSSPNQSQRAHHAVICVVASYAM